MCVVHTHTHARTHAHTHSRTHAHNLLDVLAVRGFGQVDIVRHAFSVQVISFFETLDEVRTKVWCGRRLDFVEFASVAVTASRNILSPWSYDSVYLLLLFITFLGTISSPKRPAYILKRSYRACTIWKWRNVKRKLTITKKRLRGDSLCDAFTMLSALADDIYS